MPTVDLSLILPLEHPHALHLANPVMVAAGTFGTDGYGEGLPATFPFQELGAVVAKTTTLRPRPGNPQPRMAYGPGWALNSIGLANPGIDAVLRDKAPVWATWRVPVILSIAGEVTSDFGSLARMTEGVRGVAALEVNVSCPNVEGGLEFGQSPALAAEVTRLVKGNTALPVLVKLSPNVTDIVAVARAVEAAGADGLTLINTLLGMAVDTRLARPTLGAQQGGVSGPALKPVALAAVYRVSGAVRVPVVGVGGITTAEDALAFLMAGACAVQVGTAGFADPQAPWLVLKGLKRLLQRRGVRSLDQVIGAARLQPLSEARKSRGP